MFLISVKKNAPAQVIEAVIEVRRWALPPQPSNRQHAGELGRISGLPLRSGHRAGIPPVVLAVLVALGVRSNLQTSEGAPSEKSSPFL